MLPNASACRSFLVFTLILCTVFLNITLSDGILIDDLDDNPNVNWEGHWRRRFDASAGEESLTLSNQPGDTVTLTFAGTFVRVYGAIKPVGTWDMHSQYTLDNQSMVDFRPPQEVPHHAYNQQFYDSGELPAGNHMLTITNLGIYLWLDYFQFYDDSVSSVSLAGTTFVLSTTSTTSLPSSATIITTSTSLSQSSLGGGSVVATASTLEFAPSSNMCAPISATTSTFFSSIATSPSWPSLPLPLSSSSISHPEPSASPHPHGESHGTLLTVTVATVIGVVLLALLVQLGCWCLRQIRMRNRRRAPLSWKLPIARESLRSSSPTPSAASRASAWAADVVHLFSDWFPSAAAGTRRSVDGGVRVAGGPRGVSDLYAPSISDTESEKSTLPPSYKEYDTL
ncbi:hypothetical protein V8D89_000914 [Ganoderma adspersum]